MEKTLYEASYNVFFVMGLIPVKRWSECREKLTEGQLMYGCSFSLEVPTEVDTEDTIEGYIGVTDKPEEIK
ncbi:hypothetical protein [Bacillus wiedmannii]|uniref:Uncharacterized protein n=1 Tax=Bacillus wiedmannii TaxID=1890302 RepID=A0A242ZNB6_9BACI|nr:hypothetical protein [Bacillus wiedmannii]MED3126778.1 hypothetical protein [Bacillus wiedmannii]OTX96048.1 hypothetical protein BK730_03500 [Bacillus wiedmannii]